MRRMAAILVSVVATVGLAAAEPFNKRLERGHAMLRSGDVEGALRSYRDMQIDAPESDVLHYSMGCAHYEDAMEKIALKSPEEASAALQAAGAAFEKASLSRDRRIRVNAEYNLANVRAQAAKLSAGGDDSQQTIAAFQQAVESYERFLERHPDHKAAANNLEHMRYTLKKMLQNPPPPEQSEQGGDQQQDQQKRQQDKQGDQEQSEQPDVENKPEEQQNEQDASAQQQEQQQQEQKQDQQNRQEQESEQTTAQAQPVPTDETQEQRPNKGPKDRQDLEALLQSLEDQDRRELREPQGAPGSERSLREWW